MVTPMSPSTTCRRFVSRIMYLHKSRRSGHFWKISRQTFDK